MKHESFSNVVKALRKENKLSQEKLAELCELDRTYISLLERGLRQPTLSTVFRMAKSLGLSASELVKRIEDYYENYK